MTTPDDRRYAETHEWHKPEGDTPGSVVTIGISQFAVDELTDITFVEIEVQEGHIDKGKSFGEIESVKATSEIYTAIAGEVVEVNQAVLDDPSLINQDPYGKGWLIKLKPDDPGQLDELDTASDYEQKHAE